MKIKCLIVDDEHLARTLLEEYIRQVPHLELAGKCKNAPEAFSMLQADPAIELLFLDIQMPHLTGLDFLKSLKNRPVTIFTTAYAEYAIEGYQLDVIDYLLKPITFERFFQATNKATEFLSLKRQKTAAPGTPARDYIFVKADYKLHKVRLEDILYIESLREYVSIYTPEKRIVTLQAIKNLEETLPADRFVRVHRSYIVAIDRVDTVDGNTIEISKHSIPIGKNYREDFYRLLQK